MKTILTLLTLCLTALPAFGFTPDAEELTARLNKNYGPMTSWEAKMTFPDYPGVAVSLWFARGKWRQEWQAGDKAVAVGLTGNVVGSCTSGQFPLSPLFVWMVPGPVNAWGAWGIDETVGNFGFCGDEPCLLIGAEPGDETTPAVHLNNETYAPLLIRYEADGRLLTVRFGAYKGFAGYAVPQQVVVESNGQSLDALVEWVRVNGADAPDLYERETLDQTPCAEPPLPFGLLRDLFRYPQAK